MTVNGYPTRIVDRIRWRLGILPPAPPVARRHVKPPPLPEPAVGMLSPKTYAIHSMSDYGALPLTHDQVSAAVNELRAMEAEHESEVKTPIKSYNPSRSEGYHPEFGASMGGLGLSGSWARNAIAEYDEGIVELRQKTAAKVDDILPNASKAHAGIKTFRQ